MEDVVLTRARAGDADAFRELTDLLPPRAATPLRTVDPAADTWHGGRFLER